MVKSNNSITLIVALICSTALCTGAMAQNLGQPAGEKNKPNPLNNVYFGEQHLHTAASADAYIQGNHKNDIDTAFRYNKGEVVEKFLTGEKLQRKTPYDWTAVTDHAEYLGLLNGLTDKNPPVPKDDPIVAGIGSDDPADQDAAFGALAGYFTQNVRYEPFENKKYLRSAWERHKEVMNKHNEPGKFTTLIAFEWTSMPNNQNLHRNVFFRDDAGPDMPFTTPEHRHRTDTTGQSAGL